MRHEFLPQSFHHSNWGEAPKLDQAEPARLLPFLVKGFNISMLTAENTLLLIVDVQGNLARAVYESDRLFKNIAIMIQGAQILGLPILLTEQNPKGLGPTITEIADYLKDVSPISKFSFSCCANERFMKSLKSFNPQHILIAGIEAHICVYQTARDLVNLEYEVQIISDAVSSRTLDNKHIGVEKSKLAGAGITSVETVLFELLKDAQRKEFKEILNIVK